MTTRENTDSAAFRTCILMRGVIHLMQPGKLGARPWCVVVAGLLGLMCAGVPSAGKPCKLPRDER